MNIKIKKHLRLYKGYKLKCASGKSGIINSKKEGDLATPKGTFELGTFYYRKDNNNSLKCKIKKRIIKKEGTVVGLANGSLFADNSKIYEAENLKVGLFK